MQQTIDFIDECIELDTLLKTLSAENWERKTQFEGWTINNILTHLHFWNELVDLSLSDPDAFLDQINNDVLPSLSAQGFRATEDRHIPQRGAELLAIWQECYQAMLTRWSDIDPKRRVKWVGPDMSVRSSMTARQMETWAHAQAIYDILGVRRETHDRISNVVRLGVNTFAWSFKTHQRPVPENMPRVELRLPSGKLLEFGEPLNDIIQGEAVEFAQVVTQTRNIADTRLTVNGDIAHEWMSIAQCFAGGAVVPPTAGTRFSLAPRKRAV